MHIIFFLLSQVPISESSGTFFTSVSLDSKEKKRILTTVSRVAYTPPGYLIFTEGDTVVAQPFNASNLELSGKAFTIVQRDFQPGLFSVSATDLLADSNNAFWKRQLMWLDRSGRQISLVGEEIEFYVELDSFS